MMFQELKDAVLGLSQGQMIEIRQAIDAEVGERPAVRAEVRRVLQEASGRGVDLSGQHQAVMNAFGQTPEDIVKYAGEAVTEEPGRKLTDQEKIDLALGLTPADYAEFG